MLNFKIFSIIFVFILTLFNGTFENTHIKEKWRVPSESQIRRIEEKREEAAQIRLDSGSWQGERSLQRDATCLLLKKREAFKEREDTPEKSHRIALGGGVYKSLATERYRVLRN